MATGIYGSYLTLPSVQVRSGTPHMQPRSEPVTRRSESDQKRSALSERRVRMMSQINRSGPMWTFRDGKYVAVPVPPRLPSLVPSHKPKHAHKLSRTYGLLLSVPTSQVTHLAIETDSVANKVI